MISIKKSFPRPRGHFEHSILVLWCNQDDTEDRPIRLRQSTDVTTDSLSVCFLPTHFMFAKRTRTDTKEPWEKNAGGVE